MHPAWIWTHMIDTKATGPDYATNDHFLNHCIVSFLRRLADPDGLNLEPMLYQVRKLTAL